MAKGEINQQTGRAYRQKGSCDVKKMRWVADSGSVFTEEVVESKGESGVFVKARIAIAFNVGDEVARYIVSLHNWNIEEKGSTL